MACEGRRADGGRCCIDWCADCEMHHTPGYRCPRGREERERRKLARDVADQVLAAGSLTSIVATSEQSEQNHYREHLETIVAAHDACLQDGADMDDGRAYIRAVEAAKRYLRGSFPSANLTIPRPTITIEGRIADNSQVEVNGELCLVTLRIDTLDGRAPDRFVHLFNKPVRVTLQPIEGDQ